MLGVLLFLDKWCIMWFMKKLRWLILPLLILALGGFGAVKATRATQELPRVETVTEAPVAVEKPKQVVEAPLPTVEELLELVNAERAKVGVRPLALDPLLNRSAQLKADDMLSGDYYAHINPTTGKNGPTYISDVGVSCYYQSENYTYNHVHRSAQNALDWWMNSPSHKAALLDPRYETTGFGISDSDNDPRIVVQHFCDKG